MPAVYTCDVCGTQPADIDYNGSVLCNLHRTKQDLLELQREYISLKKWIDACYISKLERIKSEMEKLGDKIKILEVSNG